MTDEVGRSTARSCASAVLAPWRDSFSFSSPQQVVLRYKSKSFLIRHSGHLELKANHSASGGGGGVRDCFV